MKALVKYAPGDGNVEIRDVDEPHCGENQIKLEIAYCGICGTDLHILHDTFRNYPPVILGHEFAGTVVEVGQNVKHVKTGDRGAGLGATAVICGQCRYCRSGYFILCPNRKGMGHGVNGAFARYAVMRPDQLYRIPPHLALEEAALSEPFAAVVQAVTEVSTVRIGDTALVSGPGPIGLLCLKLLVAEGVKTIVAGTSRDGERLAAALRFGAAAVINVDDENLSDVISEHTSGTGADAAFECAGHPASVRGCLESLRPMGRYTQVAICGHDIQFPIDQIFYKQLTLSGSVCYTTRTWERMMQIYFNGRVRLHDLISIKLPLSELAEGFRVVREERRPQSVDLSRALAERANTRLEQRVDGTKPKKWSARFCFYCPRGLGQLSSLWWFQSHHILYSLSDSDIFLLTTRMAPIYKDAAFNPRRIGAIFFRQGVPGCYERKKSNRATVLMGLALYCGRALRAEIKASAQRELE